MTDILLLAGSSCAGMAVYASLRSFLGAWEGMRRGERLGKVVPSSCASPAAPGRSRFGAAARLLLDGPWFAGYRGLLADLLRRAARSGRQDPEGVLVSQAVAALGSCALFGAATGGWMPAFLAFVLGGAVPLLRLREEAAAREGRILSGMPDALEGFALCAEAGLTLEQAMEHYHAGAGEGPLREEFGMVLGQTRAGSSRREALLSFRDRVRLTEVSLFATSVVHAERSGAGISATLKRLSAVLRDKQVQRAEKAVQEMPVKMLLPLVLCIMPVTFLILFGPVLLQLLR